MAAITPYKINITFQGNMPDMYAFFLSVGKKKTRLTWIDDLGEFQPEDSDFELAEGIILNSVIPSEDGKTIALNSTGENAPDVIHDVQLIGKRLCDFSDDFFSVMEFLIRQLG